MGTSISFFVIQRQDIRLGGGIRQQQDCKVASATKRLDNILARWCYQERVAELDHGLLCAALGLIKTLIRHFEFSGSSAPAERGPAAE